MRRDSLLVWLAVAVPILYFGVMLAAAATWPGYSHVTRYVSELGGPEAPNPRIFNFGIMFMGVVCTVSAAGVLGAVRGLGGRIVPGAIAAVCIALSIAAEDEIVAVTGAPAFRLGVPGHETRPLPDRCACGRASAGSS